MMLFPIIDSETYNSPLGKVIVQGSFSNSGTWIGAVNTDAGAYIAQSLPQGEFFGNLKSWQELSANYTNIPYISFTPSQTVPRIMVTIKAMFADTSDSDGIGEAALYANMGSSFPLLMYMGAQSGFPFSSSGWLTPRDGTTAFIVHYRDPISEFSWLEGKSYSDITELRLVVRNSKASKGITIKEFHVYESILSQPSGSITYKDTTKSSITYRGVNIRGGASSTGERAGIYKLFLPVYHP